MNKHFGRNRLWPTLRGVSGLLVVVLCSGLAYGQGAVAERPSGVVILADDLGWGSLSCHGATRRRTPACDRLAREVRRFTNACAPGSVCSPSRYGLMTGRYLWRTSIKDGYAIRRGPWKLGEHENRPPAQGRNPVIEKQTIEQRKHPLKHGELFNLMEDPSETRDVAADHPEVVAALRKLLRETRDGAYTSVAAAPTGPLAAVLQAAVDKQIIAGAVALVADKHKVLDLEAVGCASLETKAPMRPDDLFWIASMSKSITATALMMLVDEGKVKIDDPVEKYLPEFKGQRVAAGKDNGQPHPPRHPITIREIMSHTSGLVLASDRALKKTSVLKENVAASAAMPLRQEPGTKFEYNNCGINAGGRIIEVVTGQAYADFMQSRLFDPLGMRDTTFWPTEEQASRLARTARRAADKQSLEEIHHEKGLTPALIEKLGHGTKVPAPILADMGGGMIPNYASRYGEPAGGLFSTAADVGRFCQMLLNGGVYQGKRYLSEQAIRQMTSIQTGDVPVNPQEAYGLGWFVKIRADEGPSVGSFGHRGARRTVMWVDPKNQLAMVLLVERFDMTGPEQKELYSSFMKAAIAKYGKAR